jgi:hypothetical protein
LSNGRDLFLYLLPKENDATHIILPQEAEKHVRVTWFNPLSGEYLERGELDLQQWHGFESPWKNQIAVLILQGQNTGGEHQ